MNFEIKELELQGVLLITSKVFRDDRGYFQEIFRSRLGKTINTEFVQTNFSFSQQNVIRGLHYQKAPFAQGKLIVPIHGHIQDVVVDLRRESPTFSQHLSVELTDSSTMIYVPEGFAHGFAVLSKHAYIVYMCTKEYQPQAERGIRFDDSSLNISWKVTSPVLSAKDKELPDWKTIFELGKNDEK